MYLCLSCHFLKGTLDTYQQAVERCASQLARIQDRKEKVQTIMYMYRRLGNIRVQIFSCN